MRKILKNTIKYLKNKDTSVRNKKKIKNLPRVNISEDEKKEIINYWNRYNAKINLDWHAVYPFVNGKQDPRYIPEDIFYNKIEPTLNNLKLVSAYQDKNLYTKFLPGVNEPNILVRSINNLYYNKNYSKLSYDQAESIVRNFNGELIIKPSMDSGGGRNVQIISIIDNEIFMNDNKISFEVIVQEYGTDFLIQEIVLQNKELKRIYPYSLNTIRVMSLRIDDEIYIVSSVARFGNDGSRIDNQATGGLSCGINNEGILKDYAIDKNGHIYYEHPETKEKFKGTKIKKFNLIIENVKNLHKQLLYFDIVSFDIASDENWEPVFIELNLQSEEINFHQFNNGPLFGELTDAVCKKVFLSNE